MYKVEMTIREAQRLFYYDKNDPMEYGIMCMYDEVKDWLGENTNGWLHSWVPTRPSPDDIITFTFLSDVDAMGFKLRWL